MEELFGGLCPLIFCQLFDFATNCTMATIRMQCLVQQSVMAETPDLQSSKSGSGSAAHTGQSDRSSFRGVQIVCRLVCRVVNVKAAERRLAHPHDELV